MFAIDQWLPWIMWLILYVGVSCFFLGLAVGILWAALSGKRLPIERDERSGIVYYGEPTPPPDSEYGKRINEMNKKFEEEVG